MANYQLGTRWSPDILTDQATLDGRSGQGGSGAGGTTTVISGGGPDGEDVWEYTLNAYNAVTASQRYIAIDGFNEFITTAIGLWIKLPNYPVVKKVFVFLGQGGFVDYFATTIIANDLEGSNGWVFVQRPKSQFQANGGADWANPVTTIRIGVTAEITNVGGETAQVGPLHLHMNTKTKVINFFDDSNDTDILQAEPYLTANGFVGVSGTILSRIGTAGFLTNENLNTLKKAGWDLVGHHTDVLGTTVGAVTLEEQTALLRGVKAGLKAIDHPEAADLFVFPEGKYDINTIAACKAAGIISTRTTIQYPQNPAIDMNMFDFHAAALARGTAPVAPVAADWIALLEDAIDNRSSFATFSHRLDSNPSAIHTDLEEWKLYIDYLKIQSDLGRIEVVSWSEYIRGLADTIWFTPAGTLA